KEGTAGVDDMARAEVGHRGFGDDDMEWLGVQGCLREPGMPIAQMRRYADLTRRGEATMAERLSLLAEHDKQVQERVALLQAQHDHLREKIDWYRSQMSATPRRDPTA